MHQLLSILCVSSFLSDYYLGYYSSNCAVPIQKQLLMDRSIPMFNRVVIEKMQKKNLDLHHKRLDQIKFGSRKQAHSLSRVQNIKGYQLQQQRRTEIEKQNIILFNKMTRIMNRTGTKLNTSHSHNRDRLREMNDRIYQENRALVTRISNQRPTISTRKMYEDRQKHEKLLSFMGRYPYRTQSNIKPESTFDELEQNGGSQYEIYQPKQPFVEEYEPKQSAKPKTSATQERSERSKRSLHNIMPPIQGEHHQKIPLYKKRKDIDGIPFIVQVNRFYRQYELRLANLATKKEYSLFLSESEGNALLTDCDYDYNYVTSCLKLNGNKLLIDMEGKPPRTQVHTQSRTINVPQPLSLYNETKLRNFKLKEEQTQPEVSKVEVRNITETNIKPAYQFEDLTMKEQSHMDSLQDQVKIYYEEALDQELQQA